MTITIIQIILSIVLIVAILLQQRGSGIGAAFGGDSSLYYTRRGLEQSLHITTIVLAVLFLGTSLLRFII